MHSELTRRLRECGFAKADDAVARRRSGYAVRRGELIRLHPGVFVEPAHAVDPALRVLAALAYAGEDAARSHTTGLAAWGLAGSHASGLVHLSVPHSLCLTSGNGLVVHRRLDPLDAVIRDGLPTMPLERCLVDTWGLLGHAAGRGPVIEAVRRRLTTVARIETVALAATNLSGRAELLHLLQLLRAGCHSEFDIWGFSHVFDHPCLPPSVGHLRICVDGHVYYIDRAYPAAMVAVELDGVEHHTKPAYRERDLRRDAALATLGWLTVRFTSARLHSDRNGAREELRRILEVRTEQLRIAS